MIRSTKRFVPVIAIGAALGLAASAQAQMPLKTLWPIKPATLKSATASRAHPRRIGWLSLFATSNGKVWKAGYSGGTSCAGGVGLKKMVLSLQVLGPDHVRWWTLTGSTFVAGPSRRNPVRAEAPYRQVVHGHAY